MKPRLAVLALALALLAPAAAAGRPAIVGGVPAPPGAWPYAAYVEASFGDPVLGPVAFGCSGSLIGERWVLTAAHCALDPFTGEVIHGVTYRIVLGESDLSAAPPGSVYTADAGDVIAHEPRAGSLLTGNVQGDVALIRLDRPAPGAALRIPGAGQDPAGLAVPGQVATAIGYGAVAEYALEPPQLLRQVQLPIVPDDACAAAYPREDFYGYPFGFDPATMLCAGFAGGGFDTCFGDSGGPLLAVTPAGSTCRSGSRAGVRAVPAPGGRACTAGFRTCSASSSRASTTTRRRPRGRRPSPSTRCAGAGGGSRSRPPSPRTASRPRTRSSSAGRGGTARRCRATRAPAQERRRSRRRSAGSSPARAITSG